MEILTNIIVYKSCIPQVSLTIALESASHDTEQMEKDSKLFRTIRQKDTGF